MTINWLQKFSYIDIIVQWLWREIIGDDIFCQYELSIIYAYIWFFLVNWKARSNTWGYQLVDSITVL
jgi:hypothetical protein